MQVQTPSLPTGQRQDLRVASSVTKPQPKATIWPRPNYRGLSSKGCSSANLMVLQCIHSGMPTKPLAKFHGAAWRHAEAIAMVRNASLQWLDTVEQAAAAPLTRQLVQEAINSIMTRAFGRPGVGDPCYYTRRHVVDELGCQLYALLGDKTPHRVFLPTAQKLERMALKVSRDWPNPAPAWEARGLFVVHKSEVTIESRGGSTFATWPMSSAADRGVVSTFGDRTDALEWHASLSEHLVITDKGHTELLSAHDSKHDAESAIAQL